ncbi:hypothetical protein ACOMHN_020664 [Nucella lapillus]
MATPSSDSELRAKFKEEGEGLGLTGTDLVSFIGTTFETVKREQREREREEKESELREQREERESELRERREEKESDLKQKMAKAKLDAVVNQQDREQREFEAKRRADEERSEELKSAQGQLLIKQSELTSLNIEALKEKKDRDEKKHQMLDREHIHVPAFQDGDDIDQYLRYYEKIAKLAGWDQSAWACYLIGRLRGKAKDAVSHLFSEHSGDYRRVKKALLDFFQVDADSYRVRFRTLQRESDETVSQHLERLTHCVYQWLEAAEKDKAKPVDVLDIFLQKKYDTMSYGVCRQELTMPKTADEVATTATRVEAANRAAEQIAKEKKGAQGAKIGQNKPKQSGRVFSDSSSHKSYTSSPSFQSSGPSSTRQLDDGMYDRPLCHICQSPKHFAKTCPQRSYNRVQYSRPPPTVQHRSPIPLNPRGPAFHPRQPFVRPDMQRTSGRGITHRRVAVQLSETAPSHSVPSLCKHCADLEYDPKCVVKVNGIDVVGLRDTGATHCVVARELVRDSDYTGQYTELTTVSGHQYQVPIAQVDISSPFLYGRIAVAVMNQPEQKVLIGNLVSSAWEDETQKVPVYANPTYIMQVRTQARVKKDDLPIEALPVGQVVMAVTTDKLIELQREDPSLDSCAARAEHGVKTRHRRGEFKFVRDNGVLVRKFQDPRWKLMQICVPKSLRANLLQLAHDMPMGGHLGTNKTLKRLHKDFYWPGLTADVKMYCRSCPVCQKTMDKGRVPPVPLVHTPVVGEPFDKVGIDIIGPILPASDRHNRYVLVQVDYVTRYPEAIPMKSIEAENVAEKLIEMWSRTGIPKTVVTDQGSQFTSHIMKSVYRLLGIQGCTTTPYHAMANGLVERFNQTLKKMKRLAKEKTKRLGQVDSGCSLCVSRGTPGEHRFLAI